jgi:iron complex outermembrane recepter protein
MRSRIILQAACCVTFLAAMGAPAPSCAADPENTAQTIQFDIKPQPLASALNTLALQSHRQILFTPEVVKGKTTRGVKGTLTVDAALAQLLSGTGLSSSSSADGMILVSRPDAQGTSAPADPPNTPNGTPADPDPATRTPLAESLEEVIVTAQKRAERLQDVPVPVTVIKADSLVDYNQVRLQDYYTSVPGLTVMPSTSGSGGSFQSVAIRGITTGVYTNPTVGIAVDDVPYGSSTAIGAGGGMVVADIDPADLARIEVLRGPQGTLYGASSMGGLIKYVTVDPSTDAATGRVEANMNGVVNGAELGYGARGSINLPLSDNLALRASGFTRQDPGYIDNVQTGQTGINEDRVSGGRIAALWRPSPSLSLKVSALYQEARSDGFSDVDLPINGYIGPALGELQQSSLRGTGQSDRTVQAYSATLTAKLGAAELTSVTGYNINQYSDTYDLTFYFGPTTQGLFGVTGTPTPERNKTDKFTQEVRLATPIGEHVDWLLGAFFTHENSQYSQSILATDPSTGAVAGDLYNAAFHPGYTEYAGFTNVTVRFSQQFDIELGARDSMIRQSYSELDSGPYLTEVLEEPSPHIVPEDHTSANAFTYLVTPRFKVSPELMVYARIASGYRAGGPNLTLSPGTPTEYNPDKTQNYEIGAKADLLDGMLSIDGSLYYINWKDIQLSLINAQTGLGYTGNGSEAKSQGFELSVESKPVTGLTLAAWVTFSDADLKESFPTTSSAYGVSGDSLPYSSRFSGNLSLHQEFPVTGVLKGFWGGSVSYVGSREGEFTSSAVRQELPAFARTDLQAGAKYAAWTVNFFINNLADKRGVLAGGLGSYPPFAYSYIQPRTAGLSVVRTF